MVTNPDLNPDAYVYESAFAELLDMRVTDPEDGTSTVVLPISPKLLQQAGRVQAGIVAALAE